MKTVPLIQLLCTRDPRIAREEHHARVLCGEILVKGQKVRNPRERVRMDAAVEYRPQQRFVSRAGEKLEGILEKWSIEVSGLSFIDAGASTGGFTGCLLQRGAARVYAVEVGYNQLDYRLRRDERVLILERTNIMSLNRQSLPFRPDAGVADLSLRSLRRAAAHLLGLVSPGWLIALVKPQYEWLDPPPEFSGVVAQKDRLAAILKGLAGDLAGEGVFLQRAAPSPLTGRKGNQEFFFLLSGSAQAASADMESLLEAAVEASG